MGQPPPAEDYRYYVNGVNYPFDPDPVYIRETPRIHGEWRVEISVPGNILNVNFLNVLWPAAKSGTDEAVTCSLVTGMSPPFNGAFIRPQPGESAGTLHHIVGFADLNATAVTYEADLETHTNHIICRLVPGALYTVTITDLDLGGTPLVFDVGATAAGVVRFDRALVNGVPARHQVELVLTGAPQ